MGRPLYPILPHKTDQNFVEKKAYETAAVPAFERPLRKKKEEKQEAKTE